MKKLLFIVTLLVAAMQVSSANVDLSKARVAAQRFILGQSGTRFNGVQATDIKLLHAEASSILVDQPVYYIFNTSETYLVVAGDDRAEEILMVGDRPLKDINNLAPGLQDILNQYKEEITYLQEHPGLVVDPVIRPANRTSLRATTYLMTALWDQEAPYYNQCKFTYNGSTYQCLTGCPATSASMVLYYWKYPESVDALPSYTATLDLSYYNSVNFTYPALSATTFDWANMKDS